MLFIDRLVYAASRRLRARADAYGRHTVRRQLAHVGDGGTWAPDVHVTAPHKVWIGDNVHIGRGAWIRADGGLRIGDNTHISRNCVIFTVNHDWRGQRLPYDDKLLERPVEIGANVWIGMNVCVAPGARIGDGAIIGMGTVVSGDVPPLAIVGGAKFRILGERDAAHYERLVAAQQYGGADGRAYRKASS